MGKSVAEKIGVQRVTQDFKGERAMKKGVKKMKKKGYEPESVDEQGRPGWSKVFGGPLVAKRYEVTFVKAE